MDDAQRAEYAELLNTLPRSVKEWDELTEDQQDLARAIFTGWLDSVIYGHYVYEVGTDGSIISRRFVDRHGGEK